MSMNEHEYEHWRNQMRESKPAGLDGAFDQKAAQVNLGPQTYQPKPAQKRTLTEQLNFNEEMLAVLHKELEALYGMLQPLMIPVPEEVVSEKDRPEINSNVVSRLLVQSDIINRMISNVRQVQRDLQL